jgi:hypothetical protein
MGQNMHIRPEEKKVYRIVTSPQQVVQTLLDLDRAHKGAHPHYGALMPERDFVLKR